MLVVAQVATALILLIGLGLMVRTFHELRRVEPGFRTPEHVQTFQLTIPVTGTLDGEEGAANRERLLNTQRTILQQLSAVDGVEAVGFAAGNDGLPLDGDGRQVSFIPFIDGTPVPTASPGSGRYRTSRPGCSRRWGRGSSPAAGSAGTMRTRSGR
jgi:hypothetical protein